MLGSLVAGVESGRARKVSGIVKGSGRNEHFLQCWEPWSCPGDNMVGAP